MSDLDSRGMMKAIYDVISQPSGERDWESIRPLYHPRATLTRTGVAIDTLPANQMPDLRRIHQNRRGEPGRRLFRGNRDRARMYAQLGSVAQVRSVYETIYRVGDREIHSRGRELRHHGPACRRLADPQHRLGQ
jgi:hypothetical protein